MSTPITSFNSSNFETYTGLKWSGILKGITKSINPLQPIFEAFTNSIESIKLRQDHGDSFDPFIFITLNFNSSVNTEGCELYSIEIEDNGIGFNDANYSRLVTFKDDTKGFNNRGSGRVQFVHFFQYAHYISTYKAGASVGSRSIILSKCQAFLNANSLVYLDEEKEIANTTEIHTKLTLDTPLLPKDRAFYSNLSLIDVKKAIISHYILKLCSSRESLPTIRLFYAIAEEIKDTLDIKIEDIPLPSADNVSIDVPICRMSDDMKRIEALTESVNIKITPFRIPVQDLDKSEIKVTSKGEISETTKIKVTCLDPDADIDGHRYLFLLSSEYLDDLEGDERGNIEILDKTEFKRRAKVNGFIEDQIIINDVQEAVNNKAAEIYAEIASKKEEFHEQVEHLKKCYLLSDEALKDVSISDSVEEVLQKAYNFDAKVMARQNASYEDSIQRLSDLDPSSDSYTESLSQIVDNLIENIPIQNRVTLSKYVARRNMVTNLMGKILERLTSTQISSKRNEDERLLHNLIFKQHSDNPLDSDLWLINEEYMYFKGVSEGQLSKIKIDNKNLFREDFDAEEKRYLTSLGEKRLNMRCDILLFPSEGKCVIIEFKNPEVNVSDHINQIQKYAYFIRNFATEDFKILSFYGYLIGEGIEPRDVRSADGDFKSAPNNEYLFRPFKTIIDESGQGQDGGLYMEVIKYSSLKKRAEIRNKAFSDRLFYSKQTQENSTSECL